MGSRPGARGGRVRSKIYSVYDHHMAEGTSRQDREVKEAREAARAGGPAQATSPQNRVVKEARRAARAGGLTEEGFAVAEGLHLLEEALRSGCQVEAVIYAGRAAAAVEALGPAPGGGRLMLLADRDFDGIASTETSQGIVALVKPPAFGAAAVMARPGPLLVLDGIQDPGNAGAMVRTAEAFGAGGVVMLKGSVSPYNPKALRASAGSAFRVAVAAGMETEEFLETAAAEGRRLFAAMPRGAAAPADCDLTGRCAIVIGAEGGGVRTAIVERAEGVAIPCEGVESLNAAVAAGILLYEARRQKQAGTGRRR